MIHTGGSWRHDDPEWPLSFLVGPDARLSGADSPHPWLLEAINEMMAGNLPRHIQRIETELENGNVVMLDSGAFGIAREHSKAHGISLYDAFRTPVEQLDKGPLLVQRYREVVAALGDKVWGYVEIDLGGLERKRELRKQLEADGLRPIPVYHALSDPPEYFDELAESYDRICIGNVVSMKGAHAARRALLLEIEKRLRKLDRRPWIHLLGMSPGPLLLSLPMDSCDSSSWNAHAKYGEFFSWAAMTRFSEVENAAGAPGAKLDDGTSAGMKALRLGAIDHMYMHREWTAGVLMAEEITEEARHRDRPVGAPTRPGVTGKRRRGNGVGK